MSASAAKATETRTILPPIPAKRYFTIGEVSELCGVKPHVLRYWETEFPSLKPVKRRGNRRYYQHHGIDPRAVIRALGENLRGGGIRSGASTLTMQAARLIYRTPHTLPGKIRQTLRALQLETHYDKTTILRCYASLAPMGGNLEGIGSGAWYYFGKTPAELSTGEAAWLIALPQNPNRLADPDRARAA